MADARDDKKAGAETGAGQRCPISCGVKIKAPRCHAALHTFSGGITLLAENNLTPS
jgi:hypothetical protein